MHDQFVSLHVTPYLFRIFVRRLPVLVCQGAPNGVVVTRLP
jgi:hypothetical protein